MLNRRKTYIILLALELIIVLGDMIAHNLPNAVALFAHRAGASILTHLTNPYFIAFDLMPYVWVIFFIHLGKLCIIYAAARSLNYQIENARQTDFILPLWIVLTLNILLLNAKLYPATSNFVFVKIAGLFPTQMLLLFIVGIVLIALRTIAPALIHNLVNNQFVTKKITTIAVVGISFTLFIAHVSVPASEKVISSVSLRNVYIFSFDSLQVKKGELLRPECAPFLQQRLGYAKVFSDALTPLARTHPSLLSLLTGLPPKQHGARFNLMDPVRQTLTNSLPNQLRLAGYKTIFATDEVRFSNIGHEFGFDKIIAPASGAGDFIIGNFHNDSHANLLINTVLGEYLFPFLYANRAAWRTYDPSSFTRRVINQFHDANGNLFLLIHFTLAHWPYAYSSQGNAGANTLDALDGQYCLSLKALDEQFKTVFNYLEADGLLDQAIVFYISDHGERLIPSLNTTSEEIYGNWLSIDQFQTKGHGTSVLDFQQHEILFATEDLRDIHKKHPEKIDYPASILDIKPTLLSLLKIPSTERFEYANDLSLVMDQNTQENFNKSTRLRFMESGLMVPAIISGTLDEVGAFEQAQDFYSVDRESRQLRIKRQNVNGLIAEKQFSVVDSDGWGVAIRKVNGLRMEILFHRFRGIWTDFKAPEIPATMGALNHAKFCHLSFQLRRHFGNEIPTDPPQHCLSINPTQISYIP